MNSDTLLRIQDFKLKIAQDKELKLEEFSIKKNARMHLRGPSGSGKTSLMNALYLLCPFEAKEIYFKSELLSEKELVKLRTHMRYLPQHAETNYETCSNIIRDVAKFKSMQAINFQGKLLNFHKQYFSSINLDLDYSRLSGGERQCFKLLLAASSEPDILLLDECFANMSQEFREASSHFLITELQNTSIVFTHHFQEENFLSPTEVTSIGLL